MAITESKVKNGTLSLGTAPGEDFSCPPTNIKITPSVESTGDSVETLCGDVLAASSKTTWVMAGTAIQDFTDPAGFQIYLFENDNTEVDFSWTPNDTGPTWSGKLTLHAVEIGGDVNVRITTEFSFEITGTPTMTPPAPLVAATGATAGTPGSWTPSGSSPPSSVANLIAGTPNAVTANPATAWTTGQYVQTGTAGPSGRAYWDGTAWVSGSATVTASSSSSSSSSS